MEDGKIKITSKKDVKNDNKDVPDEIDMNNLQIWSWNVNGIRAILKKNRLQEFFEKINPAILAI